MKRDPVARNGAMVVTTIHLLAGCEATHEIAGPEPNEPAYAASASAVTASASGGGHFFDSSFTETVWRFSFTALQRDPSGEATGSFRFRTESDGLLIADFHARVTCMTVAPEHGRAWIGGIITQNRSEDPFFRDHPAYQVGEPTWFRVADGGEGQHAVEDRITRNFARPAGGFQNEWQFCTSGFWPIVDGVQRFTHPLLNGNLQVRQR